MFTQPLFALFARENVNCLISDTGNSLNMEERGIPLRLLLVSSTPAPLLE